MDPLPSTLTDADWERIIFALSHFSHNTDFQDTLNRVLADRKPD